MSENEWSKSEYDIWLKIYKNDEDFLSELEDAISEIIQDCTPIDRSVLIDTAKNIDIFIESFI